MLLSWREKVVSKARRGKRNQSLPVEHLQSSFFPSWQLRSLSISCTCSQKVASSHRSVARGTGDHVSQKCSIDRNIGRPRCVSELWKLAKPSLVGLSQIYRLCLLDTFMTLSTLSCLLRFEIKWLEERPEKWPYLPSILIHWCRMKGSNHCATGESKMPRQLLLQWNSQGQRVNNICSLSWSHRVAWKFMQPNKINRPDTKTR